MINNLIINKSNKKLFLFLFLINLDFIIKINQIKALSTKKIISIKAFIAISIFISKNYILIDNFELFFWVFFRFASIIIEMAWTK